MQRLHGFTLLEMLVCLSLVAVLDEKVSKLKIAEEQLPYYDFWVKAFGDKGIRKFVVDGIIPALNARIAYWMEHLYEGQIELSFDNELIETIKRNGVDAYYPALSNGEKQRVNLAVSQSFAYVMMLNSGSCPSLAFLDEITGGGIELSDGCHREAHPPDAR